MPYVGVDNIRLIASLSDPDGELVKPKWRTSIGGVTTPWDGDYSPLALSATPTSA